MSLVAMFLRNTYDVVLVMKDGDEFKILNIILITMIQLLRFLLHLRNE